MFTTNCSESEIARLCWWVSECINNKHSFVCIHGTLREDDHAHCKIATECFSLRDIQFYHLAQLGVS